MTEHLKTAIEGEPTSPLGYPRAAWPLRALAALIGPLYRELRRQEAVTLNANSWETTGRRFSEGDRLGLKDWDLKLFVLGHAVERAGQSAPQSSAQPRSGSPGSPQDRASD